jgi:hypothetical protein
MPRTQSAHRLHSGRVLAIVLAAMVGRAHGGRVWFDGKLIIDAWDRPQTTSATVGILTAGAGSTPSVSSTGRAPLRRHATGGRCFTGKALPPLGNSCRRHSFTCHEDSRGHSDALIRGGRRGNSVCLFERHPRLPV